MQPVVGGQSVGEMWQVLGGFLIGLGLVEGRSGVKGLRGSNGEMKRREERDLRAMKIAKRRGRRKEEMKGC